LRHESIQEEGFFGIEGELKLGTSARVGVGNSEYAGSAYGDELDVEKMIRDVHRRIDAARLSYGIANGIDPASVVAKIGCAKELAKQKQQHCYRYRDQETYPSGGYKRGLLAPRVFAPVSSGQVLFLGIESTGLAASLEAAGARHNNLIQQLRMNKRGSVQNCMTTGEEQYSNSNPGSIYIQFVRPELKHADMSV
jgi:hypothetical protein